MVEIEDAVVEVLVMEGVVDGEEEEEVDDVEVVDGGGVNPPYVQSEFRGIYGTASVTMSTEVCGIRMSEHVMNAVRRDQGFSRSCTAVIGWERRMTAHR